MMVSGFLAIMPQGLIPQRLNIRKTMFSELKNISISTLKYLFHTKQKGFNKVSEEIREELVERMKNKVRNNRNEYTITPEGIDFVIRNEDIIRFNEGTTLKFNIPSWSLPIFERHISKIRKTIDDSRIYPTPKIVIIKFSGGMWRIKFDTDDISLLTYIKVDELCEELEKNMKFTGK